MGISLIGLIFIPKGWTRQQTPADNEIVAWEWFTRTYPAVASHLLPFAAQARKRTDKGDFWWELRACSYYKEFEQQKLIYPLLSQGNKFSMENTNSYLNAPAYIIPTKDYFLLGLLNSILIWFYLSGVCSALRGGVWRLLLQSMYMDNLPIPTATEAQKYSIATLAEQCQTIAEQRYAKQQAVRQRIPDLAPHGTTPKLTTKLHAWWLLDFPQFRQEIKKCCKQGIRLVDRNAWEIWLTKERTAIDHLTAQLKTLEQELNTQVYQLFGLTAEEIKLVEQGYG